MLRLLPLLLVLVQTGPPAIGTAQVEQTPTPAALPTEPGARAALERALAGLVDERRAAETVRTLVALGPRMGGTASGKRAAEHRAKTFAELGLAVRTIEDPETWAHEERSWELVAHASGPGGERERLQLVRAWPHGFSPSIQGRFPVSRELRAGAAHLVPRRVRRSREGDPVPALRLVDGHVTAVGGYPRIEHLRPSDQNPYPVFGLAADESAWIAERLDAGREVELEVQLDAVIERAQPLTVEGRLAAREGAAPGFFVICAHGDSDAGGPGANDNGSGEAIVYEIARAWTAAIAARALAAPAAEVRFVIWGKEIHSTQHYLATVVEEDGPLLGVLNYDQAGFGAGAEQLNVEPDDLPANEAFVRVAASVLADHAGVPGFPVRWATNKSLGGTDSYVFSGAASVREAGIPSVTLFTSAWDEPAEHPRTPGMPGESWQERDTVHVDYDPYYHSAGDLPQHTTDLEPHNMAWCARVGWFSALRWLER